MTGTSVYETKFNISLGPRIISDIPLLTFPKNSWKCRGLDPRTDISSERTSGVALKLDAKLHFSYKGRIVADQAFLV